ARRVVGRRVPFADAAAARRERRAPGAAGGARARVRAGARDWLRDALGVAGPGGRVVVFDYVSTTAEMAARPQQEWLRTYRGHRRGGPPLADLGTQDITCEVAVDQPALVREPDARTTQAAWLRAHGADE